ncbi:MAG: DUF5107 domain-containing protein [Alistipes sp.]|nr:DUF5107 domain-containing protein [Alistipes sp.]
MKRLVLFLLAVSAFAAARADGRVRIWSEPLELPTYVVGAPETAPSFSRNFAFQRARRSVYPLAMNDNITDRKEMRTYNALYLENEYVKLCVLPEIGGRLFYAVDKTDGYDIFYHQHVIKPSNVGMTGAWISGGVEWNVFHHHRGTSQLPVDYKLVENADGSATIWVGETEYRHRMSWAIGMTLHPDKSYIEITGRLINQTADTNSILYWSNVATSVNPDYQIFFPQSTEFGVYHAKNSFCHYPVSHEVFTGKDYYADGLDVSWWKNHKEPNSIFIWNHRKDFLGGYDHAAKAGTMLCGDHNIVKGGKFWLWGPGKYGAKWDCEVLTDNDGPYCELMVGAYSDNQPDYSWISPYEVKEFTKYWYGVRDLGGIGDGCERGAVNFTLEKGRLFFAANATEVMHGAKITLEVGGRELVAETIDIAPDKPFAAQTVVAEGTKPTDVCLTFTDAAGALIARYMPVEKDASSPVPETVKPTPAPKDIENIEELYFAGLRLKQFHQAHLDYMDYFDEVLRRDPEDVRANTQVGIHYRQCGDYGKALKHLRTATERQMFGYTRPADCEALYNLGLTLKALGRYEDAKDTLNRAAWSYAYTSPAMYQLAQIDAIEGQTSRALAHLDKAIRYNADNYNALNLKASVLRRLGSDGKAAECVKRVLELDPVNAYASYEAVRLGIMSQSDFETLMRGQAESYLELAVMLMNNGFAGDAESVLSRADEIAVYPTVKYYLGFLADARGDKAAAERHFKAAAAMPIDYCFPFRLETLHVYDKASEYMPDDAATYYYKGNLLYDKQPDAAMAAWERCVAADPKFAMAWRNLGWAYKFHKKDMAAAAANYEKAIAVDASQAIFFEELDEVYETMNADVAKRCRLLADNHATVCRRYAPLVREIRMLTLCGECDTALDYLTKYFFSRQEGVDDLHDVHVDACLTGGLKALAAGDAARALEFFLMADEYPDNQWVNRDDAYARDAQIFYLTSRAYEALGRKSQAKAALRRAAAAETGVSDYGYYKALALKALDKKADTDALCRAIVEDGRSRVTDFVQNYFVSFGPGKTVQQVNSAAYCSMGYGYLGLGDTEKARECFAEARKIKADNLWACYWLGELK